MIQALIQALIGKWYKQIELTQKQLLAKFWQHVVKQTLEEITNYESVHGITGKLLRLGKTQAFTLFAANGFPA